MNNYHVYEAIGLGKHSTVYKGRMKKSIEYYAIKSVDKSQRDLMSLLKEDGRLPEDSIHDLAHDIVKALQFLHSKGIIYCDLKPSNILLDENGHIKLCDFGLAIRLNEIEKNSRDMVLQAKRGTPCYMAPELFKDGGVNSYASDFWALGCVLYECFAGKPPFVGNEFTKLAKSILLDSTPDLPNNPSDAFVDLVNRILNAFLIPVFLFYLHELRGTVPVRWAKERDNDVSRLYPTRSLNLLTHTQRPEGSEPGLLSVGPGHHFFSALWVVYCMALAMDFGHCFDFLYSITRYENIESAWQHFFSAQHMSPNNGPSDLHHETTVFPTSVARRQLLRSFQPLSPYNSHFDFRRLTTVLPTSITRQRSFQPPSPADNGSYDLHLSLTKVLYRLWSFRPPSPGITLSDLRHPLTMVLPTSVACQLSTSIACQLRPSDVHHQTTGLPTSVARQRSFRPPSPDNGLSDLRHLPTTVFLTSVTH
ncbi:hypothetical protein M5K25_004895 [Dendrobium thyrsiflorum]|uniref:Protein kinase domain-containing protein n=1 Tax=Dendrobium thyrsiflorum TaxID=117978 RepID=A0ABD0VGH5_DENTH